MKTVAFVPIKLNNERVPGKNIKALYDGTPLLHCILKSLKKSNRINEIYVYCSDSRIKDYLLDGIHYIKRDARFDGADADINQMHYSFTEIVEADVYVLAHATAPFLKSESIDKAIEAVESGIYDSVVSVTAMREFIWENGLPMNFDLRNIPRTQDLNPLYIETTGMYVFLKKTMEKFHSRTGKKPYLLELSKIEALDIDYQPDFDLANALYRLIKEGVLEY